MRRTVRFVCAAIVASSIALLGLPTVHAATPPPTKILTITPATEKPKVDPGGTNHGSFQIINQGQQTYPVRVYSAEYSVQGEDYKPDFTPLPGRPMVSDWLHFNTSKSTVAAGQTVNVDYTINVPAGTQPGGYYAVAFVETKAGTSGQGVIINERVGEIFYITVNGPVKQAGKLLSWTATFLQQPPLAASLRLENDGGVHYPSDIQIKVTDIFGNTKYSLATQKEVLPQTIRRVSTEWKTAPPLGLFKVSGSATVLGKTQTLSTKYVLVVSRTVRFILLALVLVLLAFALGKFAAKRIVKRKRADKPKP